MDEDPLEVDIASLSNIRADHVARSPLLLQHDHLLHRDRPLAIYGPWETAGRPRSLPHDLLVDVDGPVSPSVWTT